MEPHKQLHRGAALTVIIQLVKISIQFGSIVWLARLLSPHDYGTFASALVLIGFGEILKDAGLSTAAIQSTSITSQQQSRLFWINAALSAGLVVLTILLAKPVSAFFSNPEVELVVNALSWSFMIGALGAQYRAHLTRKMRFGTIALVDLASQLMATCIAVLLAESGFGIWSLVFQYLIQSTLTSLANMLFSDWHPALVRRGDTSVGHLVRFGVNLLGTQVVGTVAKNADSAIIGRFLGQEQLGFYNRGYQIIAAPFSQLTIACTSFALPILSRVEQRYYTKAHQNIQSTVLLALYTALSCAAVFSAQLIPWALGSKWVQAAEITEILSFSLMIQAAAYPNYWVFLSRGMTAKLFKIDLILRPIQVALVVVAGMQGVTGVVFATAFGSAIAWYLYTRELGVTGIDLSDSNRDAAVLLAAFSLSSGAAVLSARALDFGAVGLVGYKAATFIVCMLLFTAISRRFRGIILNFRTRLHAFTKG